MAAPSTAEPWSTPGWSSAVNGRIRAELGRLGISVIGPGGQPHRRPWSTVLSLPTVPGIVYLKVSSRLVAPGGGLTRLVGALRPERGPKLLVEEPAARAAWKRGRIDPLAMGASNNTRNPDEVEVKRGQGISEQGR
jgi:hypothetical protein